jgi:NAD(P)-dependent dehydrogenase (short-subunit alcohol dehydrogenase family)
MGQSSKRGAVVISGASTGIGRVTALHLDRLGHRVFAGVRKDVDADSLRQAGSERLSPIFLDVTDAGSIESAAKVVQAAVGEEGIGGLVNNAGIGVGGPLEFLSLDELRHLLEVNVVGVVAATQAFLPLIRKGGGRIVIVGSIGGRFAAPISGPYAASKFAVEALTDSLRVELRTWNLHVALIEPGAIATSIFEKTAEYGEEALASLPEEQERLYGSQIRATLDYFAKLGRRAIPPEHVARAIEHALTAARPRTRYLIGTDARIRALIAWLLPDRARDALILRLLGLNR